MALEPKRITGTIDANEDSLDTLHVDEGGVVKGDLIRTAGSITISLQVSLDNSTFVQAYDTSGGAISFAMSSSLPHSPIEFVARAGAYYKLVGTDNSSGEVDYVLSLVKVA